MRAPEFWTSDSVGARIIGAILSPIGLLYGLSIRARRACTQSFRPRARVICVGNLTAGGSGKTPIAIALGETLMARGYKIAFLTRGYGGRLEGPVEVEPLRHTASNVGDEALLLAGQGKTIVARNRAEGARFAEAMGLDIILMDDGHQNFQIAKDLSLVVVDKGSGFGNGRVIPAGPLREPVTQGLARADAVVMVGQGDFQLPAQNMPIIEANIIAHGSDGFRGARLFAFAGIGRPEKFFQTLREVGADVIGTQAFADHHPFSTAELQALKTRAMELKARLVTTEKDWVRIDSANRADISVFPVRAQFSSERELSALLDRIIGAVKVVTT